MIDTFALRINLCLVKFLCQQLIQHTLLMQAVFFVKKFLDNRIFSVILTMIYSSDQLPLLHLIPSHPTLTHSNFLTPPQPHFSTQQRNISYVENIENYRVKFIVRNNLLFGVTDLLSKWFNPFSVNV